MKNLLEAKTKDEGLAVLYEMYRADLTAQAAKEKAWYRRRYQV